MTRIAEQGEPAEAPESAQPNYVGLTIDERYQVLRPLGSGGMGTVVLARHAGLKRLVAIKFLEHSHMSESGAAQRLFREAQAAAAIGHPNIVDVLDVGVSPWGDPYLVMEFLEGEDLDTFTSREGLLSVSEACCVAEAVLHGLAAAHDLGIVHRDLKPQNIVLGRKRGELVIKIIDFGIAKVTDPGVAPLTRSGELVGTPSFMSPEQAKGEDVDGRSDLFSIGVLFHRLITGKNPFSGGNYHSLLHRIATAEPELASELMPEDARRFVERCLVKDPALRFQSASETLAGLSQLDAWQERKLASAALLERLHTPDRQPDTVLDRPFNSTPPGRSSTPKDTSYSTSTPVEKTDRSAPQFEPTLATSASSPAVSSATPRRRSVWWALALLVTAVAFVGGWWASTWRPHPVVASPPASGVPEAELQIGKGAFVKLYPATPGPTAAAPSVEVATASPSAPTVTESSHSAPPPARSPATGSPKPAGTLSKTGKNSFFSEVFE